MLKFDARIRDFEIIAKDSDRDWPREQDFRTNNTTLKIVNLNGCVDSNNISMIWPLNTFYLYT